MIKLAIQSVAAHADDPAQVLIIRVHPQNLISLAQALHGQ